MAWTATVTGKTISNGLLQVVVAFNDGKQTFTDKYETRNLQDDNWLNDNIKRRISDLDGVITLADKISTGVFVVKPTDEKIEPTGGRELYKSKLETFEKMVSAIRKGVITDKNESFVTLKTWLQTNFLDEYIDLF
jgi:hypothetical protein